MNTYDRESETRRIRLQDFVGGQYLSQEDLDGPIVVTIIEIVPEKMPGENKEKLVAHFEELDKRLILNTTNIQLLRELFGVEYADEVHGRITLYVDPHVKMQGKTVGGIRVKAPRENGPARRSEERRFSASHAGGPNIC